MWSGWGLINGLREKGHERDCKKTNDIGFPLRRILQLNVVYIDSIKAK